MRDACHVTCDVGRVMSGGEDTPHNLTAADADPQRIANRSFKYNTEK